jgi:ribosomal protein L25 (general stress protein Ctc)
MTCAARQTAGTGACRQLRKALGTSPIYGPAIVYARTQRGVTLEAGNSRWTGHHDQFEN